MSKRSHHHHHHHHHHAQQNANTTSGSHTHAHNHHNGSPFPPLGLAASGAAGFSSPSPAQSPLLASGSGERGGRGGQTNGDAGEGSQKEGLPPAPQKVDTVAAQQCRLQDAYWSDDEEDMECPLCLEEIDLSDANFKPCPCGYQICRFCWHHIKQNLNGRCPACRRKYSDQSIEFKPMSSEEIKRLTQAKKQKEKEKKELENMNRKHLANMRVVQKNLVYVVGLSSKLAKEELIPTLRSNEYFGQYGRISKILISKRTTASKLVMGTSESNIGVYVTYHRKEDAARAIVAIDGSKGTDGKILRASYGTTKYCTTYLRNLPCTNPACTYLHEPGEEADSFTKEDLSTLRHAAKDMESKTKTVPTQANVAAAGAKGVMPLESHSQQSSLTTPQISSVEEASALPKTASWASGGRPALTPVTTGLANGSFSGGLKDSDMPPLSASSPSQKKTPAGGSRTAAKQSAPIAAASIPPSSAVPSTRTSAAATTRAASRSNDEDTSEEIKASPVVPQAPPGLSKGARTPSLSPASPVTSRPSVDVAQTAAPSAPPGLVRTATGPPPGLGPSRASSPLPPSSDASAYHPSASAQAVLDDMRQRREAAETSEQPHESPFPDFDYTLSRFSDGDFSFNFPTMSDGAANGDNDAEGGAHDGPSLPAFAAFPGVGNGTSVFGLDPLRLPRDQVHSNGQETSSPSASAVYTGPFNPFAGDEHTFTISSGGGGADDEGPFRAIYEMQKELSEEGQEATGETASSVDAKTSRFDFAKREPVSSAASPQFRDNKTLRSDLYNDQDPLALSKDVSGILGSVFDQEPGSSRQENGSTGAPGTGPAHRETNIYGRATQAQAQAAQQAHASQLPQAPAGQSAAQHRGPPGLTSVPSFSSTSASTPFTPHSGHSNNWYHDLQQQRAQQQNGNYGGGYGEQQQQHRGINGGAMSSEQSLLAQIMAGGGSARRNMYAGGQQGSAGRDIGAGYQPPGDLPFFDPAIMSMNRQQQAQAAQQQQSGGAGPFSPFDQHSMPHQVPHHQQGGYGGQGPPAGGHQGAGYRSPYSTMS